MQQCHHNLVWSVSSLHILRCTENYDIMARSAYNMEKEYWSYLNVVGQGSATCGTRAKLRTPSKFQWHTEAPWFTYQFCYDSHRRYIVLDLYKNMLCCWHSKWFETLSWHTINKRLPTPVVGSVNLTLKCEEDIIHVMPLIINCKYIILCNNLHFLLLAWYNSHHSLLIYSNLIKNDGPHNFHTSHCVLHRHALV